MSIKQIIKVFNLSELFFHEKLAIIVIILAETIHWVSLSVAYIFVAIVAAARSWNIAGFILFTLEDILFYRS